MVGIGKLKCICERCCKNYIELTVVVRYHMLKDGCKLHEKTKIGERERERE